MWNVFATTPRVAASTASVLPRSRRSCLGGAARLPLAMCVLMLPLRYFLRPDVIGCDLLLSPHLALGTDCQSSGSCYGRAAERRMVVDILEDRNVESCTEWLRRHPDIAIISRDRCGLYAQAARQGAPQALQVTDRFHLVQNLRMAIEEQMNMHGRATGRAHLSDADNISTDFHLQRSRLAHRKSREEIFTTIHALRENGLSCSEIERQTGFRRRSVARWLAFKTPPDRRRAALTPTSPWYFEEVLAQCWKDGNRRGRQLFHEVQQKGYDGSYSHLERLLAGWRRAEKQVTGDLATNQPDLAPVRDPQTGHAISPVIAAALCIKPKGSLTPDQARKVDALKTGSPACASTRSLAMRFNGILRGGRSDPLDAWIDNALESTSPPSCALPERFTETSKLFTTPSNSPGATVRLTAKSAA